MLVDSLGTWVSGAPRFTVDTGPLLDALRRADGDTVLVSEEVGLGVHPETATGMRFRDALGDLNRAVAAVADETVLVVAGRPLPARMRRRPRVPHAAARGRGIARRRALVWFPVVAALCSAPPWGRRGGRRAEVLARRGRRRGGRGRRPVAHRGAAPRRPGRQRRRPAAPPRRARPPASGDGRARRRRVRRGGGGRRCSCCGGRPGGAWRADVAVVAALWCASRDRGGAHRSSPSVCRRRAGGGLPRGWPGTASRCVAVLLYGRLVALADDPVAALAAVGAARHRRAPGVVALRRRRSAASPATCRRRRAGRRDRRPGRRLRPVVIPPARRRLAGAAARARARPGGRRAAGVGAAPGRAAGRRRSGALEATPYRDDRWAGVVHAAAGVGAGRRPGPPSGHRGGHRRCVGGRMLGGWPATSAGASRPARPRRRPGRAAVARRPRRQRPRRGRRRPGGGRARGREHRRRRGGARPVGRGPRARRARGYRACQHPRLDGRATARPATSGSAGPAPASTTPSAWVPARADRRCWSPSCDRHGPAPCVAAVRRDAPAHPSPNAGVAEAAFAAALGRAARRARPATATGSSGGRSSATVAGWSRPTSPRRWP